MAVSPVSHEIRASISTTTTFCFQGGGHTTLHLLLPRCIDWIELFSNLSLAGPDTSPSCVLRRGSILHGLLRNAVQVEFNLKHVGEEVFDIVASGLLLCQLIEYGMQGVVIHYFFNRFSHTDDTRNTVFHQKLHVPAIDPVLLAHLQKEN